ncbi:MAG: hypothetical protein NW200_04350 [Hyphomonadaceae bacterium]|nr:hypothetical protein [Hyphomonadaceae bacterium]
MRPLRTLAAVLSLVALTSCGLKAGLEKPPPAWGEARRAYEADLRAKADAAEKAKQAEEEKAKQNPAPVRVQTSPTSRPDPAQPPATPPATPKQ